MSNAERTDQDSPWKEILEAYFPEAIAFFFPEVNLLIDWTKPHTFLDKEFQQISREADQGRRYADKLVRVWSKQGKEQLLLLHLEVQAQPEKGFDRRIFVYNYRIFDRLGQHPISLALLCDNRARWRPQKYSFKQGGTELLFKFNSVKLLDYRSRWAEMETSNNPFAIVVMAYLKMLDTQKSPQQRKQWKFGLTRRLYEAGWAEQEIRNLYRFIDWVMILPKELEAEFWLELKSFEEERNMAYMTTGERIGYERGQQDRERALIFLLLTQKMGELSQEQRDRISALSSEQLESLAIALLNFSAMSDLENWLANHA
jgi:hypothetical protein